MCSLADAYILITSTKMRWAGKAGDDDIILIRKPESKMPVLILRLRWEDNIKSILKKCDVRIWTGCERAGCLTIFPARLCDVCGRFIIIKLPLCQSFEELNHIAGCFLCEQFYISTSAAGVCYIALNNIVTVDYGVQTTWKGTDVVCFKAFCR
jgi:hypothetical protein